MIKRHLLPEIHVMWEAVRPFNNRLNFHSNPTQSYNRALTRKAPQKIVNVIIKQQSHIFQSMHRGGPSLPQQPTHTKKSLI